MVSLLQGELGTGDHRDLQEPDPGKASLGFIQLPSSARF